MEQPIKPPPRRRRALPAIAGLFLLQVALIFLLGERPKVPPTAERFRTDILLAADGASEQALAAAEHIPDPTVFALPSAHNFSSKLWLEYSKPNYHLTNWSEAPRWLDIQTNQLGRLVDGALAPNAPRPVLMADKPLPAYARGTASSDLPLLPTQSVLRVEGDLARREMLGAVDLPDWPHSELLTNTVVRVLASPLGHVISSALMDSCGLKEADQFALSLAANLRFKPEKKKDQSLSRGLLVFEWRTMEQPTTAATQRSP